MATKKITQQDTAESVKSAASFLITQLETPTGSSTETESLRRASLAAVIAALRANGVNNGYQTVAALQEMYPTLVKTVEATSSGIKVTYWDNSFDNIAIESGGLAFDAVTYDQQTGYLHITLNDEDVVDPCYIGGGGGGGSSGSTITITNRNTSRNFSVTDTAETVNILFSATSVDSSTSQPTGNLTAIWTVNGNRVSTQSIVQGNGTFDVKSYLTSGSANTVKLTIEDTYGGTKSMTWTVTVTSYSMSWNIEEFANHGSDSLNIRLVPNGQGNKTVKVTVDGTSVYNQVVATSGRAVAVTIPAQTHGAHTVLAWLEVTVDGETLSTTPLRHVGIWTVSGTTTPIVAFLNTAVTVPQYNTVTLKYRVYNPASESATVTLAATGETSRTATVGRDTQTWAYRPTTTGAKVLSVTCGTVASVCNITVSASQYDINPVTRGLIMDLDPTGHSNTESGANQFGYKDGNNVNHPLTYSSNFDWVSGGFQQDSDGVTALVIKRGTYVDFDRSFFNDNAKTSGKEIKIVFKATECRNYDATVLDCRNSNIGLHLQAQQGTLSSALQSATVQYCEDKQIEMDINIESTAEDQIACVWLEGVPSRAIAYEDADNWQQSTPMNIRIGSDDCDVWIYRIRMYSTSLTRSEVLDNFIADCGNVTEMVNRYERNDIFNTDGTINQTKLATARPELRVIHITADRMTTSKSDTVTCSVTLKYTNGGAEYEFTATGVKMKAQGTSSLEYILAALNLDLDFSDCTSWKNGNDQTITGYSMTANSIAVNYINLKLNVASSESANNVCCTDDYNTYQPYINPSRAANPKVRDVIEGHPCAVFFTNSSASAIEVGARNLEPGETMLYGCGDICNSKKNYAVFGQDTTTYPNQSCLEIGNNNNQQCLFKSDDLSTETWDGEGNFEFRYPKSPTQANKTAWQTVLSWVVSTNPAAATGDALPEAKTYGTETYTTDTAAYRKAKFKYEFEDYFSKASMLYHYLFTERHCMVDNRAKNTFLSYEYDSSKEGYRWNICKDYDNDTMAGNDNSGGLTFTYGLEDTDTVGAAYVFNAHDSVLWTNIKEVFADDLVTMFKDREAAGAWQSSRIISKWKTYQSARPEALIAEDMWGKYFAPYINDGESRYIKMMLGTKEDQFRQFQTYQEKYMSAKYGGSISTADRISLRANAPTGEQAVTPDGDIKSIVPYASTYLTVKYGNAGTVKVRAARGQSYNIECPEGASLNDLETYIYSASNISSIGSLAALYTKFADISSAVKLKQLILGSSETGYSNPSITSESGGVSFGSNIMMEKIDLRGLPNMNQGLDLSSLKALKEIYTTNSGITGVTFARRAPVEKIELNAVRQLICRDLTSITTFSVPYTSLQTVWIENCPFIDEKAMVTAATSLTRGRLIGVNWTGDKAMSTASLLNRLAGLAGLDASGGNTDTFVLTGAAHVTMISSDDYTNLTTKFPELTLTYGSLLPRYTVTFKNYNEATLNTQRVDQGSAPTDPRSLPVSPIPTPTKPSTAAKTYTFDGWSWTNGGTVIPDLSAIAITENTTIYAHFNEAAATYKVRWYNDTEILEEQVVTYGSTAVYSGDIPVNALDGNYSTYYLFKGWDKSTGNVVTAMDVYAQYDSCTPPAAGTALSAMRPVQLKSLIKTGILSPTGSNNTYIASGDTVDMILGNDLSFDNVTSHELVSLASPQTFDGTNYYKPQIGGEDIKLFDTDKTFTLVVDYQYTGTTANATILAGGLNVYYSSNPIARYGQSSGTQTIGTSTNREIVVFRHRAGDDKLYVYASKKAYDTNPLTPVLAASITYDNETANEDPLCLGATMASDGFVGNYATGTVYWAKLYYADLGETDCKKLAAWPRETVTIQAVASGVDASSHAYFRSYKCKDGDEWKYSNCCFLMKDLMSITHKHNQSNTNAGGWDATGMRDWLNNRVWLAIPLLWQQIIRTAQVKSSAGSQSTELNDPPAEDKLWLPSCKDVGFNTGTVPYSQESDGTFTVFTNDASRIKKLNNGTGSASHWWLRSPNTATSNNFWTVKTSGSSNADNANYSDGVAFGFCI